MAEAIQAYAQKHRDDKNFNKNMLSDPDIQRCQAEMKTLEAKLNNAVKAEQDKFMQWEKKEMKGQNVIIRNNNYISAAGKSNAIKKGLIGANEIASFGNIDIKNSKNETISGNLADIVHSVTNLLHQKTRVEKDEAKKSEIGKVIQKIINSVKDFFGIQKDNKEQLEEQSKKLSQAITMVIEKYLDNGFRQVQTNLEAIKQKDEQGKINYQSMTKDTSDLSSNPSTSEKNDIVSQLKQVLDGKNEKQVIDDDKGKQVSTSASQNIQQTNKNEKINENKNINTTKLLDKKETENKSKTDTLQDDKIKDAIQDKNNAIDTKTQTKEKELSPEELKKQTQDFIEKESENKKSELIENNDKNDAIKNNDIDNTIYNDDDFDDIEEIPDEFQGDNVDKKINTISSFDMPSFKNRQLTFNDKSNDKQQTKTNNIKISINKRNNKTIEAPKTPANKIKETGIKIG